MKKRTDSDRKIGGGDAEINFTDASYIDVTKHRCYEYANVMTSHVCLHRILKKGTLPPSQP